MEMSYTYIFIRISQSHICIRIYPYTRMRQRNLYLKTFSLSIREYNFNKHYLNNKWNSKLTICLCIVCLLQLKLQFAILCSGKNGIHRKLQKLFIQKLLEDKIGSAYTAIKELSKHFKKESKTRIDAPEQKQKKISKFKLFQI